MNGGTRAISVVFALNIVQCRVQEYSVEIER